VGDAGMVGDNLNEAKYGAKYWEYQRAANKFGGRYHGDTLRHLLSDGPQIQSVLEFGCSGGYILAGLPYPKKYGVELNSISRKFAKESHGGALTEVWKRIEEIPAEMKFDVIYTTHVLEHVDCPICELRKLTKLLAPSGRLIVNVRNDGVDHLQQRRRLGKKDDPNHHIYTWNELLLTNMLEYAGLSSCGSNSQFDAWLGVDVEPYEADKYGYCRAGLKEGKKQHSQNLWIIAVAKDDRTHCPLYRCKLLEYAACAYLHDPNESWASSISHWFS